MPTINKTPPPGKLVYSYDALDEKDSNRNLNPYLESSKSIFLRKKDDGKSIKITYLSYLIIFFILGIALTLFVQKILSNESINFSSLDLITFTFSIALSGASIVLAISAIDLGKKSEQLMMIQNEESIDLQNKIFIKTSETLQKIGTSTGITEKRIEDITSGKVGIIAENVANKMLEEKLVKKTDLVDLENNIRNSLTHELKSLNQSSLHFEVDEPSYLSERKKMKNEVAEQQRKIRIDLSKKYESFHEGIIFGLANTGHYEIIKTDEGDIDADGYDLVDGVFRKDKNTYAICSFLTDLRYSNFTETELNQFFKRLALEIVNKSFSKIFITFPESFDSNFPFARSYESLKEIMPTIAENIVFLTGSPNEIIEHIEKDVS